jgi:hypothetical protein
MNYATIEEAWGDMSGRKRKKNKNQDPICELYETKMNSYSQLDLVNNSNGEFEKSKYQRNMRPMANTDETEVESSIKNVNIDSIKKYYDASDNNESLFEKQFEIKKQQEQIVCDEELEEYVYKRQPSAPKKQNTYYEEYLDNFGYSNRRPKLVYLDIILYIISGIILIFLLEQFVQMGKTMANL